MGKNIYLIGLIVLVLFSCKNSGPDITTNSSPAKASIYYGVITINKAVLLDEGTLSKPTGELKALFSVSPLITNNVIGATSIEAGGVTINNHLLTKYVKEGTTYYEAPLNTFSPPPYLCVVSGTDNLQAFSYKLEGEFPDYKGFGKLPDTVSSKSNLTINLTEITNADEIEIYLTDRVSSTTTKHITADTKTVTFSLNEIGHLLAPSSSVLVITCYKSFYETFNGKKYKFRLGYKIEKYNVFIKP